MKSNIFNKLIAKVFGYMGKEPTNEPLELSAEEKQNIDAEFGVEGFAEKFMKDYNLQLKSSKDNQEAKNLIASYMAENQEEEEEEEEEAPENDNPDESPEEDAPEASVAELTKKLIAENKRLKGENAMLASLPEDESLIQRVKQEAMKEQLAHSKTHVMGSGNTWDAVANRPWNANLINGKISSTDWNKINIDQLNTDLGAYSRRNSSDIMSMIFDELGIPAHWQVVTNVQDEYVFTSIATGEITQAFKAGWLPKNRQRFVPIVNKVFDKQIDAEWSSKELKSIEKSWLNMWFNEGSTPYKMSFVQYLISELLKKARQEDKISLFKGVYQAIADDATVAGSFLNSMDGFLKKCADNRNVTYKPYTLGAITETNIYDKVNTFVKSLPYDLRNKPGMKFGLSMDWHKAYENARELKKGGNNDYMAQNTYVDQYPNIEFVPHPQLDGCDFMYVTTEDNIGIMLDVPGEENIITIERTKRTINAFGDYKSGVFVKAFGAAVDASAPLSYDDQIFFSNEAEVVSDTYLVGGSNDATPSVADHYALALGSTNTSATDVTTLDDAVVGQTYYLYGDGDTNYSTIKDNTSLFLNGGDFELQKGDLLVLKCTATGKFVELDRIDASAPAAVEEVLLDADATTIDASLGTNFVTQANTGATAITSITNAVAGETYTITGGSDTDSSTIADGGIFLLTAAFTAGDGDYIKLYYNDGIFREVERG